MARAKILVVDDDEPVVRLLKENLELEGYEVITGFDGGMAIDLATSKHPHLIVMEINMSATNGFDALKHLRRNPQTSTIPVIFMTGIQSKTLYSMIDRFERVTYVKKPFELDSLNRLIGEFLIKYPVEPTLTSPVSAVQSLH